MGGIPLLNGVHILANLGEDVGLVWWREDPVEVGLVEAFPGSEDLAGCMRRGER